LSGSSLQRVFTLKPSKRKTKPIEMRTKNLKEKGERPRKKTRHPWQRRANQKDYLWAGGTQGGGFRETFRRRRLGVVPLSKKKEVGCSEIARTYTPLGMYPATWQFQKSSPPERGTHRRGRGGKIKTTRLFDHH